jgi:cobaltochelatase CobN
VFDLWGSAAMRTGGEDLGQAMALIGARPIWDNASNRVSGFQIDAIAALGRPRVDVTIRISGLFRDVFPEQISLFDAAVRAVAEREDEPDQANPLREAAKIDGSRSRIFGAAPGAYGTGVVRRALAESSTSRKDLGAAYLEATGFAYEGSTIRETTEFRDRVAASQAFVHVHDLPGQDVLDSDAFADHEGGFAAAAESSGASPALYHLDATDPAAPKARALSQEIARALRGRAANPRWIEGQMRHGFRGAAEIAESVDNLFAFAATTNAVTDWHFDLLFDSVCANPGVRAFLAEANPQAAKAIAERFESALARGLWQTRRNSVERIIDSLKERP